MEVGGAGRSAPAGARATASRAASAWDARLYDGLRISRIAADLRMNLGAALGQVGVEAEYLLLLTAAFPGHEPHTVDTGAQFLSRMADSLQRLVEASASLEAATQGYLAALDTAYPGSRGAPQDASAWWPPFTGYVAPGEPLEVRLRRCGFAYRSVIESQLSLHLEAILEQMALTLYALSALPPAGVAPISALYEGLDQLASALQGEIVPRHIVGLSYDRRYPGALAAINALLAAGAGMDTSIERDIAWAREQYTVARASENALAGQAADSGALRLAAHDSYQWAEIVGLLEGLRRRDT